MRMTSYHFTSKSSTCSNAWHYELYGVKKTIISDTSGRSFHDDGNIHCYNLCTQKWKKLHKFQNLSASWIPQGPISLTNSSFAMTTALKSHKKPSLFQSPCIFSLSQVHIVSWEPEGRYQYSKMFYWEPEWRYHCTKSLVIAPFLFLTEHVWIVIVPFWFSMEHLWIHSDSALLALDWRYIKDGEFTVT